jgi:HlyD family secretion protein
MPLGQPPLEPPQAQASSRRPGKKPRSRWHALLLPTGALLAVSGIAAAFVYLRPGRTDIYTGPTWDVRKERLQITIVERGTLESAENRDVVCRVRARSQGSTVATTIKWVIDDGTEVERGQKLVELDDSGLQEQLKTQNITVNKAGSELITATQNCKIVESQNYSDIKTAEVARFLAEIDVRKFAGHHAGNHILKMHTQEELKQYLSKDLEKDLRYELNQGTDKLNSEYLQILNDIEGRIEVSRSDREQQLDRHAWSTRMANRGFMSRSQVEADKAKLASFEFNLLKVQGERDIFMKHTVERTATDLWAKVKEAERALERVKTQAMAKKAQAEADRDGKRAIYDQEAARRDDLQEEIDKCTIYAPQDGMVVYFISDSSRYGGGSQQSTVAQGEPVREGQKIMRIPNLNRMQVNVRVHEAMVSKVRGEHRKSTGYGDRLRSSFTVGLADPYGLAGYHYGFGEVRQRDEFRDREEYVAAHGQEARIQIDAHPGRIHEGRVKSVAAVASQAEFFSSDVKVYQTIVSIVGTVDDLKPGMSAEVTILAKEASEPVLVIPIQSVLGNVAMGAKRKCFVVDPLGRAKERDIVVGLSNDKVVEVKEGLAENEKVVLSPKALVGDKSNLRAGTPSTRRGAEFDEGGGKKKGKKGGGGAMPPGGDLPPGGPNGQFVPGGPGGGAPPPRGFNKQ